MTRYVPTSGADTAETLSRALWALSRPVRGGKDTVRVFSCTICLDGAVWLAVATDYSIPVHPTAELGDDIPAILQPWINEGLLPPETLSDLASLVLLKRGQRLVLWDAFPELFRIQSKTREELIELGLLITL